METVLKHLYWLGHDSFLYHGEPVIYFDPYQISKPDPKADLILITHEHFDHCSPEDVAKIKKSDTIIVTNASSAGQLKGKIEVVEPGDSLEVCGIKIQVYPAYNTNKQFHPRKAKMLAFMIMVNGVTIYHAGDTDIIEEMADIHPDIALLPVSGTYVMSAEEAVKAALKMKPKIAIPMHYGTIVGSEKDATLFKELLTGKVEVVILPKR